MGNTYGSGDRSRFGESSLGIELGTTIGTYLGSTRGITYVFLGGNGDGKN